MVDDDGVTVLFSTHQIGEVEDIGDHVGILHEGRMFWQGPIGGVGERVRRFAGELPPGIQRLHGDVVWGEPEAVAGLPAAEPVSLEAAFVAIARQDRDPP
ncbi:MAG: hypothetical protein R3F59_29125 [Myxococcota bacterium]